MNDLVYWVLSVTISYTMVDSGAVLKVDATPERTEFVSKAACVEEGKRYISGARAFCSSRARDCNQCTYRGGGFVGCTLLACPPHQSETVEVK